MLLDRRLAPGWIRSLRTAPPPRFSVRSPARGFLRLAVLLLIASGLSSEARVFYRWGAAAGSNRALQDQGGTLAYQSSVTINGGKGNLDVFSFERSIADTVTLIDATFKTRLDFSGGSLASGSVSRDGRQIRLILIMLDSRNRTMVFKLDQSEEDAEASRKPAQTDPLPGITPFPGATPALSVEDRDGGYHLTASTAAADPGAIQNFFAAQLAAAGWRDALPAASAGASSAALRIFQKGNELCLVHAQPSGPSRLTRITVLHKRGGAATNSRKN
jgi:hypothetical protein